MMHFQTESGIKINGLVQHHGIFNANALESPVLHGTI